jgi:phosphohistidine phosphatase
MRTLILVRHAKSSWSDPTLEDHDRPLNARGRRAAPVIAEWLSRRGHLPDLVLCSSSVRTRETFARMAEAVPGLPEPVVEPAIYHATPAELLARCAELPEGATSVMLIGHQPGLGGFARRLSAAPVRPRCATAFEHFPTAAAAVLTLELEAWREIAFGSARFIDFARPRDLMDR